MASVLDIASAILKKSGPISTMKLQKLVYYCQAWHLVWDEEKLFSDPIEAWANGPVAPALYAKHRGSYSVSKVEGGDARRLTVTQRETVEAVYRYYGCRTGQWLSDLTHSEAPWADAREGLDTRDRSTRPIPTEAMQDYYSSLPPEAQHDCGCD